MVERVASGVVRYEPEDAETQYLLLLNGDEYNSPVYDHASGSIKNGESPPEAVLREFEEETGFTKDGIIENLVKGQPYRYVYGSGKKEIHPFLIEVEDDFWARVSDEHITHRWVEESGLEEEVEDGWLHPSRYFHLRYVEEAADIEEIDETPEVRKNEIEDVEEVEGEIDKIFE
jgi:8-oxo-dGTP pyrophosphatase MutT (NUDIX family)